MWPSQAGRSPARCAMLHASPLAASLSRHKHLATTLGVHRVMSRLALRQCVRRTTPKMNETPRHHHDASDSCRGNGGMNRSRGRGHAVSETRRCVEARRCQPPNGSCLLTTTGRCVRRGPSLSYSLLSELGEGDSQQGGGGVRRPGGGPPVTAVAARKARRKQERVDKARRVRAWERVAGSSGHKQQSRGRQDEPPPRQCLLFTCLVCWSCLKLVSCVLLQRAEHAVSHTRAEAARRAEEPQEAPVEQRRRRPPPSQGQADGGGRHAGDEDVQAAGPVKKRKRVVSEPVQRASLDRQRMLDDIEAERSLQSRLAKKLKKCKVWRASGCAPKQQLKSTASFLSSSRRARTTACKTCSTACLAHPRRRRPTVMTRARRSRRPSRGGLGLHPASQTPALLLRQLATCPPLLGPALPRLLAGMTSPRRRGG